VVSVDLTDTAFRSGTTLTISDDNTAKDRYEKQFGVATLGAFLWIDGFTCRTGVEFKAKVTPSNYTGSVVLRRTKVSYGAWDGSTLIPVTQGTNPVYVPSPDNSPAVWRDDDPQSGKVKGFVYDLDAPGPVDMFTDLNHTFRIRQNLSEYAVLDSEQNSVSVSAPLPWYSAVSCTETANGPVLDTTVGGDNQANVGTVPLSWNLQ
jgi:hypothetical protein